MSQLGERAVVCGAGMGGLLAARVLSEFYRTVTLVERDRLSGVVTPRRGVPQGSHFHSLLSRGSQELDRLFPGLLDDLVAAGATVCDDGGLARLSIWVGGHEFNRTGEFADPTAAVLYLLSRPLLESCVRRRVRTLDNVEILDGHDVVEPTAASPRRVTGVEVVNRDTNVFGTLPADLVVDSMGRAPRTPAFLESLGFSRPIEERSATAANYASQLLRIPEGMIDEKLTYVVPEPERLTGGAISTYEGDTSILTVGCTGEQQPPGDLAGMIALAARFVSPALLVALHAGEPLGQVAVFRYPGSVWRRYDRIAEFPGGLLVFGDAICSTNPIYGQGMTVAILEAVALRECLSRGDDSVSRRFFDAAAGLLGPVWAYDLASDAAMSGEDGRTPESRQMRDVRELLLAGAESSVAMTEHFFRVMHLIDLPTGYAADVR